MTTTVEYPTYTQTKQHDSGVSVDSNIQVADTTRMSVDSDGAAHIMSLLTDLYSDPEATVIREYISNALDSHAAAGNLAPIKVSLPSAMSPNFVVQDFGTGMSAEDIRQIYASYGRSTKRSDMRQIGAYGLGCKSALTMVQSFTIVAVKNGEKTVAIISRGEDGVGEIKIISVNQTDEANGVKVAIPVKNTHSFNGKAHDFFFTMKAGSILVDGMPPKKSLFSDDYIHLDAENSYISRKWEQTSYYSSGNNGWYVIMGGVSYKIKIDDIENLVPYAIKQSALWSCLSNSTAFKIYSIIPIASVDLTPSREGLRYSDRTKKFLADLVAMLSKSFIEYIQKDIEGATSRVEAIRRYRTYGTYLRRSYVNITNTLADLKWKGEPFSEATLTAAHVSIQYSSTGNTRMYKDTVITVPEHIETGSMIYYIEATDDVKTAEYDNFVERMKRNFSQFIRRNEADDDDADMDEHRYLFIFNKGGTPTTKWFTDVNIFDPITEQEILDGAAKWRKDRRAANAGNKTTGPRNSGYQYVSLIKDSNGSDDIEYGIVSAKDIKETDLLFDAETHEFASEMFEKKWGRFASAVSGLMVRLAACDLYGVKLVYLPTSRKRETLVKRAGFEPTTYQDRILAKSKELWYTVGEDARNVLISAHYQGSSSLRDFMLIFSKISKRLEEAGGSLEDLGDEQIVRMYKAVIEADAYTNSMEAKRLNIIPQTLSEDDLKHSSWFSDIKAKYPLIPITDAYYQAATINNLVTHFILYIKAINNEGKDD